MEYANDISIKLIHSIETEKGPQKNLHKNARTLWTHKKPKIEHAERTQR